MRALHENLQKGMLSFIVRSPRKLSSLLAARIFLLGCSAQRFKPPPTAEGVLRGPWSSVQFRISRKLIYCALVSDPHSLPTRRPPSESLRTRETESRSARYPRRRVFRCAIDRGQARTRECITGPRPRAVVRLPLRCLADECPAWCRRAQCRRGRLRHRPESARFPPTCISPG